MMSLRLRAAVASSKHASMSALILDRSSCRLISNLSLAGRDFFLFQISVLTHGD